MSSVLVDQVPKSSQDHRQYRLIELSQNGLQCMLVSDPEADTAAAALDVNVGYFQDPENIQGLAHFLEHMLFLGSEKYPDISEYEAFLNAHGGKSNAYTAAEHTNYYFDVNKEYLKPALDRFAQFFVGPLFSSEATDRELNAVDSENAKNLQSDVWRIHQLLKSAAEPTHPFYKFGTGNKQTLKDNPEKIGINVREELLNFHKKFYSASIMKLCVIGHESLDTLQLWVEEMFSAVKNSDIRPIICPEKPLSQDHLGKIFRIVPVKDDVSLSIIWQCPAIEKYYQSHPLGLLSHLLGHESQGSILSHLKSKGWAISLNAGPLESVSGFSLFSTSIELTDEGLENTDNILMVIFEYIEILRHATADEWNLIFEELSRTSNIQFQFKGIESPFNYCSTIAKNMQKYKKEDVLSGPWLYGELDLNLLQRIVSGFTIENCRVEIVSKCFEGKTDHVENWYSTSYSIESITESLINDCRSIQRTGKLHLPLSNEFIAKDLSLRFEHLSVDNFEYAPRKLLDNASLKLWHKVDNVFKRPKAFIKCYISLPASHQGLLSHVCFLFFRQTLSHVLEKYYYNAHIAGLSYDLSKSEKGMLLTLKGFNEKMPILLEKVISTMCNLRPDALTFATVKQEVVRQIKNYFMEQPYSHCMYYTELFLQTGRYHVDEVLNSALSFSLKELEEYSSAVFKRGHLEIFIHGNILKEEAESITQQISSGLGMQSMYVSEFPDPRMVVLEPGTETYYFRPVHNSEDLNSAIVSSFQIGEDSPRLRALADLLEQILYESFYSELRTTEQLGYIVYCGIQVQRGMIFMRFIVQSSVKPPHFLDQRIENFLLKSTSSLASMPNSEFDQFLSIVIDQKLEKDKTLSEENRRLWTEISRHRYDFLRRDHEIEQLKNLSLDDLVKFYKEFLCPKSALRRKFAVYNYGNGISVPTDLSVVPPSNVSKQFIVKDPSEFKSSKSLYPSLA